MRLVALVLFIAAAVIGVLGLSLAIAFGREYGIDTFWLALAWAGLFTLVPLVAGLLLLRRSKRHPVEQRSRP
jgi:hypothetical protein